MYKNITLDITNITEFIPISKVYSLQEKVDICQQQLKDKSGAGNDFLGWIDLPSNMIPLLNDIKQEAERLRSISDVIVVVGIGGSFLGAKAVIDALSHSFHSHLTSARKIDVLFAGHNLSEDYHGELFDILDKKEYSVIVISKSGTTTEPAIAFRLLKKHLAEKYGNLQLKERIIAITDKSKGALQQMALHEGFKTFIIPDDVGGRFSVLTPVGLLPISAAGFDISQLLLGAKQMAQINLSDFSIERNPMSSYAASRYALYSAGYSIELLVSYHPKLTCLSEWWKQLFGESEGKEHKGLFPASALFTTDLHSLGQYIQDGKRIMFETVLSVQNSNKDLIILETKDNLDDLNYIKGRNLHYVNLSAEKATTLAHLEGQVPNIHLGIPYLNEFYLGQLIYFFEMSCAISGYLLGVNPFNQPGVEAYKRNMFHLLGKPGF